MEGSLFDEALTLCSRYLQDETHYNHRVRNHDRVQKEISPTTPFLDRIGRALAGKCIVNLHHKTWLQAHRYVLFNYIGIEPYLKKAIQLNCEFSPPFFTQVFCWLFSVSMLFTSPQLVFEINVRSITCIMKPFMNGLDCM
jgi:hypothetical protein